MIIGLASDHAGYELKEFVKKYIEEKGISTKDFGAHSCESCDYPDYAHPLAKAVEDKEADLGIALCGSGNGIAMTLNKHNGVRAAICWNEEISRLTRAHNDANILVLPARFISKEEAKAIIDIFLHTAFEGGRHLRRINKIPIE